MNLVHITHTELNSLLEEKERLQNLVDDLLAQNLALHEQLALLEKEYAIANGIIDADRGY